MTSMVISEKKNFEIFFDLVSAFLHYTNARLSVHFSFKQLSSLFLKEVNVRLGFHTKAIYSCFFIYLFQSMSFLLLG